MGNITKKRIDLLLVDKGLVPTRHKAQGLILSGNVLVNNKPIDKAGFLVSEDADIRIRGNGSRFVGRGGDKIDPAFSHFNIDLNGVIAIDVGASTGGFTDCMLQRGANLVYAVDVGYNQLDHRLRTDPRVVVMERTHARDLPTINFEPAPEFAVIDVSFIGIRKILSSVVEVVKRPRRVLALVKPQFELEPEYVSDGGIVKEVAHHKLAVQLVSDYANQIGMKTYPEYASPLKGEKKGNQEYFLYIVDV